MGKDDCTFALRKMHTSCSIERKKTGAEFVYRCVKYKYFYTQDVIDDNSLLIPI